MSMQAKPDCYSDERLSPRPWEVMQFASIQVPRQCVVMHTPACVVMKWDWLGHEGPIHSTRSSAQAWGPGSGTCCVLTVLNSSAACSRRPTRPLSVKYRPEHTPSSSGDRVSSETADSSSTLEEIFWNSPQYKFREQGNQTNKRHHRNPKCGTESHVQRSAAGTRLHRPGVPWQGSLAAVHSERTCEQLVFKSHSFLF